MIKTTEYYAGKIAFEEGLTDADNPHPIGSEEALDWFDGWQAASNER